MAHFLLRGGAGGIGWGMERSDVLAGWENGRPKGGRVRWVKRRGAQWSSGCRQLRLVRLVGVNKMWSHGRGSVWGLVKRRRPGDSGVKRSHRQLAEAEPAPRQSFWSGGTPQKGGAKPGCGSAQGIGGAWWFVKWNGGSAATLGAVVPKRNGTNHRSDSGAPESPTADGLRDTSTLIDIA